MGHFSAISRAYQRPELHEEDFVRDYLKVEPVLSLNPSEVIVEGGSRRSLKRGWLV
jgi:hypothetical protein